MRRDAMREEAQRGYDPQQTRATHAGLKGLHVAKIRKNGVVVQEPLFAGRVTTENGRRIPLGLRLEPNSTHTHSSHNTLPRSRFYTPTYAKYEEELAERKANIGTLHHPHPQNARSKTKTARAKNSRTH